MILLHIVFLLAITFFALKVSNNYLKPSFLLLFGYLISAVCCLYNVTLWEVSLHLITLVIIYAGLISFVMGNWFGERVRLRRITAHGANREKEEGISFSEYISSREMNSALLFVLAMMCIGVTILLYREIVRIANLNFVSWGNLIYNFRMNKKSEGEAGQFSSIVNYGLRITLPVSYVCATKLICDIQARNKARRGKRLLLLIPPICYVVQCTLRGLRIPTIGFILGVIYIYIFAKQNATQRNFKVSPKILLRIMLGVVLICVVFYNAKFVIGKLQDDIGVVGYVTNYLGGSLQLLDMYTQNPPVDNNIETFAALINSLHKFGLLKNLSTTVAHEYRSSASGVYIGNIYTGFRLYHHDFGFAGVVFFSFLLGCIFSSWYKAIKSIRTWNSSKVFWVLLYASFIYMIFFHFFTDYFYTLLGVGKIFDIIVFYFVVRLMLSLRRDFTLSKR